MNRAMNWKCGFVHRNSYPESGKKQEAWAFRPCHVLNSKYLRSKYSPKAPDNHGLRQKERNDSWQSQRATFWGVDVQ